MEFVILFLIIMMLSLSIRALLKRKIEEVIPITVVLISIIILICGLFDKLNIGIYLVEIIAFLSFIYNIVYFNKKRKEKLLKEEIKKILTPGFFIYLFLFIFFSKLNRNLILDDYDEFNHWGLIVKNMFFYNGYGTVPNSKVTFNEYPPFTANFLYLLLKLNGQYLEDRLLIGQNLLYLSFIIPITRNLKFKNIKKILLILLVILFVPLFFYKAFFYNLLVDGLLGILFAIGLFIIFKNDEDKLYKNIIFIAVIIALSLIKTTGIILAILLVIFEFINKFINNKNKESRNKDIKNLILLLIIPLLLVCSWFIKINISKVTYEWDFASAVKLEYKVENKENIKNDYFDAFFNNKEFTVRELTLFYCILALFGYSFYIYGSLISKREKKEYLYIMFLHTLTFLIFFFGLLWVYLTMFLKIESEVLACYGRYLSTFLISWVMLNSLILCDRENIKFSTVYIFFVIVIFFFPFETYKERYINKEEFSLYLMNEKSNYLSIDSYRDIITKKDRVFFFSNVVNPFVVKINRYQFFDLNIVNHDGNVDCTDKEFSKMLQDNHLDYVYVWKINETAYNYSSVFEDRNIEEDTLYKVVKDKEIKLKKVNR